VLDEPIALPCLSTGYKRLKKRHAEQLLKMALDDRRRPADRKWARDQLSQSGYVIDFVR
jgi:hypothetical protein